MSMIAKKTSGVKPGAYDSTIVGVYDLGLQYSEKFKSESPKCLLLFEVVSDSEMPTTIPKFYTLTLSEKGKLRPDIEILLGRKLSPDEDKGFAMRKLLGLKAHLQIIDDDGKSKIASIIKIPANKPVPVSLPLIFFDMDAGRPIPQATPEYVTKIIKRSTEFKKGWPPQVQEEDNGPEPEDTDENGFALDGSDLEPY